MTATSTAESLGMFPPMFGLPSRIVDLRTKKAVGLETFLDDLMSARVIYIGENHPSPHDHAVQAGILRHLWRRDPSIWVGVEMVSKPFQGGLDAWLAGETEEEELLAALQWEERWGYDFMMYRPIFEFARAHRLPLFGLNAPSELTKAASQGGLEGLSAAQRAELPELDTKNEAHRKMVAEAFEDHKLSPERFERFYLAQLIWDETMAESVRTHALAKGAPHRGVVLAGLGHVRERLGIPSRAERRGVSPDRVVVPVLLDEETTLEEALEDPAGDYAWIMAADAAALPEP